MNKAISLYTSYPLSNLALGKSATATTSSTTNVLPYLNDGNLGTRWESADQNAQTITIDLGGVFDLERVVLNWEAAYASAYTLEVSTNGTAFTPLYTQPAGTGGREELAVTGTGRYLRLNMTQRGSVWQYSILELEAYGLPQKTGGPVLSTLTIAPGTAVIKDNVTQQFTLKGYDQYGTLMTVTPTWAVLGKGSISATGLYTPNGGGLYLQPSFTVTATVNNLVVQATVVVEETSKLTKLDIQPLSSAGSHIEMAMGSAQQFTYLGTDQFGTPFTGPLTWTASGGGAVTTGGSFMANQLGDWLVFGRNGTVSDTTYVTVKPFAAVNLATFKPVKTSSVENDDPGEAGKYAVDRNLTTTRWASKYTNNEYLYVDLQATYRLNKVVVQWQNPASTYEVRVSNDALTWTTVASVTSTGLQDVVTFPETVGRYVEMLGKTRSNGYGYSIYEFQVYGTGVVGNQAPTVALTSPANNATITGLAPVALTATAADADGSVAKVEFYVGTSFVGASTAAPYGTSWTPAAAGAYALTAKAYDNQNALTTSAVVNVTVSTAAPGLTIPGTIEAEAYGTMSGVATEPTADTGGGQNVGYIDAGDWLDYPVNVTSAGTYAVQFRVAGWNTAAQLQLKSGATVLATVNVPTTANGQAYATTPAVSVTLPAGSQTLRVAIVAGGFNFNWMSFAQTGARGALAAKEAGTGVVAGYPNPTEQTFYLTGMAEGATVTIRDAAGRQVQTAILRNGAIDVRQLQAGLYILTVENGQTVEKVKMLKK